MTAADYNAIALAYDDGTEEYVATVYVGGMLSPDTTPDGSRYINSRKLAVFAPDSHSLWTAIEAITETGGEVTTIGYMNHREIAEASVLAESA